MSSPNKLAKKPEIVNSHDYVLIGSKDHALPLLPDFIIELNSALDGAVTLKMEDYRKHCEGYHPFSTEIIAKASMGMKPVSYLPESDKHNIGYYLLQSGVPEEIAEVSIPHMVFKNSEDIPRDFFAKLPVVFEDYKESFSFINTERAVHNYMMVLDYGMRHNLDVSEIFDFSLDFKKFMGKIREAQFWKPDLENFRKDYQGKIAVCCGGYHIPFVKSILEGKPYEENLDWKTNLEKISQRDLNRRITAEQLKEIYQHINAALGH